MLGVLKRQKQEIMIEISGIEDGGSKRNGSIVHIVEVEEIWHFFLMEINIIITYNQ